MYNKEEQDIYYMHKFLIAIMFDNDRTFYKTAPWLFDLNVLSEFKDTIVYFGNNDCINPRIRDNIYQILFDGRDINDEYLEQRIDLINEIIKYLNSCRYDNYIPFYRGQLYLRTKDKEYDKYTDQEIAKEIDLVDNAMFNDFIVLLSHGSDTTDEDFENKYLPDLVNNYSYYESLNMILEDCPSMFNDKLFVDRMNSILTLNKEYKKENKLLIKRMKKYN